MGTSDSWKPGDPIGYIQPEIPEFEMPLYGASGTKQWCRTRWTWPSALERRFT